MLIIRNRILPIGQRHSAINLFGVLFVKQGVSITSELVNHERIHTAQMRELIYVPFYILYVLEWLVRVVQCRGRLFEAYMRISFEQEAYKHSGEQDYLARRRHYAQFR